MVIIVNYTIFNLGKIMNRVIILGSGNSSGVPRIDGYWGKCNKRNKKNYRTRCSAIILKGSKFFV